MTVGEQIKIASFNATFDERRGRLERLDIAQRAGLDTWEEQTPDEVIVNIAITVGNETYENEILFARPQNDGSFRWCGDGFIEERV